MTTVLACLADLQSRAQSVAGLGGKVAYVRDVQRMVDYFKRVPSPCLGIIYEGRRSGVEAGSESRRGQPKVASFGLYLMVGNLPAAVDVESYAIDLLTQMEGAIKNNLPSVAPGGHPWRFVMEIFADQTESGSLWLQRWETNLNS